MQGAHYSTISWSSNQPFSYRAVLLAVVVEKSKKCLDFSITLFLVHLMVCTLYGGFPMKLDWWVVHVFGTIIMVVLGEYVCSRRELDDIPLLAF